MLRIKKPTLFILGLALSSSAFAATYKGEPCLTPMVTIPEIKPGFAVTLTALALKPGASNLNYVIYNKELPAQSPTWIEKELRPDYHFAFGLGLRYFMSEGKDINLDWTHLYSKTDDSTTAPDASYFLGPDYEIGPQAIPIRDADSTAKFKYDVVNLDVGQHVQFGKHVDLRFFGGLSTAFLREEINTTYSGTTQEPPFRGPFNTTQDIIAKFTGIGPRIGLAGAYTTDYHFGLLGEGAISALVGSTYAKTDYTSSAVELADTYHQSINEQFIKDENVTQVIPAIDGRLGIFIDYTINNSMLIIKAGYQAAVYINAISQYIPDSLVEPLDTGGIFVDTMSHTLSNYSVQGPFLEATWVF